jgi:hypothetical protein
MHSFLPAFLHWWAYPPRGWGHHDTKSASRQSSACASVYYSVNSVIAHLIVAKHLVVQDAGIHGGVIHRPDLIQSCGPGTVRKKDTTLVE